MYNSTDTQLHRHQHSTLRLPLSLSCRSHYSLSLQVRDLSLSLFIHPYSHTLCTTSGQKRVKEDWENIYYWGMGGGMAIAAVLLYYKPDTSYACISRLDSITGSSLIIHSHTGSRDGPALRQSNVKLPRERLYVVVSHSRDFISLTP